MAQIYFDPNVRHVLAFRHGPRAQRPPKGNTWDYDMMLAPSAHAVAERTVAAYFPTLVPARLRCSRLPRSRQTLELLWPAKVTKIITDDRLGISRSQIREWAPLEKLPSPYDATPQECHAVLPCVIDRCANNLLAAAQDCALHVALGQVGALCSHSPIADTAARLANLDLGIVDNGGWLPGKGFESGAFLHLGYTQAGELAFCNYYPVPPE